MNKKTYEVREVFTPTTPARVTFVEREAINDKLVNALITPGKQLVVYGRAGSGKTTLLVNKLHQVYERHVTSRCFSNLTLDQLVLDAFDQLGSFYETERVHSKKKEASHSLQAEYLGIKAVAKLGLARDEQVRHQRMLPPQLTPQTLARFLGEANCCWVIEDFHKMEAGEKCKLSQIMKVFMDLADEYDSLKIIAVGAVDTARQLVEFDPELSNRISEIYVPLMTGGEIIRIPQKGGELLNFTIDLDLIDEIVKYSNGLASVCHQLCLNLCYAADITETLGEPLTLTLNSQVFDQAIKLYIDDASDTLKSNFDKALRQLRRQKYQDQALILRALSQCSLDGLTQIDLLQKIRESQLDYPRKNLTYYLDKLQTDERGAIIRYDPASGRHSFSNALQHVFAAALFKLSYESTCPPNQVLPESPADDSGLLVPSERSPEGMDGDYQIGVSEDQVTTSKDWFVTPELDIYAKIQKALTRHIKYYFDNPRGLSLYLEELRAKIESMPFVYKDLSLSVMDDFVDHQILPFDLDPHELKPRFQFVPVTDRLKQATKIVLLGSPGIGKTTFLRHTVLKIIIGSDNIEFLHPKENLIPFFVPLKVVDNSAPYPILHYILNTSRSLLGIDGLKVLTKLAQQRRVFLFLDGYDEIQFIGGSLKKNYIQEELSLMMATNSPPPNTTIENNRKAFYEALTHCRVWLSSRKEFFAHNSINMRRVSSGKAPGAAAFVLLGIGDNRLKLISTIFRYYKRYSHLLNARYFLGKINSSDNDELIQISYNPLFLTIMCYSYAQRASQSSDLKIEVARSSYELIDEFIDLLLHDLDESKSRYFPYGTRMMMLNTRNRYLKEKKAFLSYFAGRLLSENKTAFDLSYITCEAIHFFESELSSPEGRRIVNELKNASITKPNFILQLVYSGIFITVDKQGSNILYDFPHRSFAEVLASKYPVDAHGEAT